MTKQIHISSPPDAEKLARNDYDVRLAINNTIVELTQILREGHESGFVDQIDDRLRDAMKHLDKPQKRADVEYIVEPDPNAHPLPREHDVRGHIDRAVAQLMATQGASRVKSTITKTLGHVDRILDVHPYNRSAEEVAYLQDVRSQLNGSLDFWVHGLKG